MNLQSVFSKYKLIIILCVFCTMESPAQTDMDAIMMNKKQFCFGFDYIHSSWDNYWEGTLKRTNQNIGTVTTQAVMFMPNYGITNNLNIMASAFYVWTHASAGTMSGLKGIQDFSLFVKWRPVVKTFKNAKVSLFVLGGLATPMNDYVIDHLPLSIGLGTKSLVGRGMVDFQYKRMNVTASAAYHLRSNVKIDRTSYFDTEMHYTNEVKMPNAAQYQLRAGYRGKYFLGEALLNNWTTLGGFDITRNNMPFPSNRMNSTSAGVQLKYTIPSYTSLSFIGGASTTLAGRNVGQTTSFNAGVFYAFYFKQ